MSQTVLLAGTAKAVLHFDEPVAVFQQDATLVQTGEIEINTLIFQQGEELVCFVSADALYTSINVREAVMRILGNSIPLKNEHLILVASHSHNAPTLDDSKPHLCKLNPAYKDNAVKVIAATIIESWNNKQQVKLTFGTDTNNLLVNRRLKTWGRTGVIPVQKVKMLPNSSGPIDNQLRCWMINTLAGEKLGIIWNYSCHPTAYPKEKVVHPDFPGDVRNLFRKAIHKDIPVLFFPGFLGNLRPALYGKPTSIKDLFYFLLHGKIFKKPSLSKYNEWCQSLYASLKRAIDNTKSIEVNNLRLVRTTISLKTILKEPVPGSLELFALSGIGKQVFMMASAEVLVEYQNLLKPHLELDNDTLIPISCVNTVFGYLPCDRHIAEGGYEVELFMPWFSLGSNEFYSHMEHDVIDPWVAIARRSKETNELSVNNG